jgi:HK97 family phage prohead protease
MPGALKAILATCDTRFLVNHSQELLPLARTRSGTMTLKDTPSALTFKASLDPRMTLAADLAVALERGDVSQMSMAFTAAPGGDSWDSTMTNRTITRFASLTDVSAVTYPCSPTTSIELAAKPDPVGGPDGSIGANWPSGPGGVADGTGSRNLKFDLAAMRSRIHRNRAQVLAAMRQAGASDEAIELQRARFRHSDARARNRAFDRQLSELS